jgi:ElaB/YqjD/DUF883 family membrane-anchored ribosome-binding protein
MAKTDNGADTPLTEHIGQAAKEQAQQAVQQGQQAVSRAWDAGRTQFRGLLTGQKERLATGLGDYAEMLRSTSGQLREQGQAGGSAVAERLADRLAQISDTVHQKEIEEILSDTEDFARSQPAVFLTAVGVLGFVLARFVKSSRQALVTS